ncbi:hypothetical protein L1887_29173 [Cichorium endivia]|nr:hypothetical protein L1887_29173 [Cichorium endivia]
MHWGVLCEASPPKPPYLIGFVLCGSSIDNKPHLPRRPTWQPIEEQFDWRELPEKRRQSEVTARKYEKEKRQKEFLQLKVPIGLKMLAEPSEHTLPDAFKAAGFQISADEAGAVVENHDPEKLQFYGGVDGLAKKLKTCTTNGLAMDDKDLSCRQELFGTNEFTEREQRSFWVFVWEALQDMTLMFRDLDKEKKKISIQVTRLHIHESMNMNTRRLARIRKKKSGPSVKKGNSTMDVKGSEENGNGLSIKGIEEIVHWIKWKSEQEGNKGIGKRSVDERGNMKMMVRMRQMQIKITRKKQKTNLLYRVVRTENQTVPNKKIRSTVQD